eukprot:CAMPEP_0204569270 /NCGR_PEP_ID=MMETSP0661-20131031/37653_1 /ASSEMBLY_ACC=CAM_ASM_000606 /TAXON_ID=109239 /ORGANISM="Alexandrium margalefi, Strain AMGDE01CS-322" /LENGTH=59 /DNA_ID=CAMNT_0051577363 /DNA_START=187 /DNA_END=366 /DNA_ORIENTATION=-
MRSPWVANAPTSVRWLQQENHAAGIHEDAGTKSCRILSTRTCSASRAVEKTSSSDKSWG